MLLMCIVRSLLLMLLCGCVRGSSPGGTVPDRTVTCFLRTNTFHLFGPHYTCAKIKSAFY